jgi:hypothetical protein
MSGLERSAELPRRQRLRELVDELAAAYGGVQHDVELRLARTQFDKRRGRVFDDDAIYEDHMALFLEWYVIERHAGCQTRPVVRELSRKALGSEDREILVSLARSYRSVFEVVGHLSPHKKGGVQAIRLYDLVKSSYWAARWWHPVEGMSQGEIFEARLLPWRGDVVLGPSMLFHPTNARKLIHGLIESWQQSGELALAADRLAAMRLRQSRFRNISMENIYNSKRVAQ